MFSTIVSVEDVASHTDDPQWVVLDCRHSLADFNAGKAAYDQSHIPRAFFVSVERDLAGTKTGSNGRHPLPDPQRFAELLRGFGVTGQTQIVAYDAGGDMFAARLWFVCRYIGHDAVAVLDGGFAAWRAADLPVTAAVPAARATGNLQPRLRPDLIVNADDVLRSLGDRSFSLLDARSPDRFAGQNETMDPVGGHIPGASNRWFKENFDASGRFKPSSDLREEFQTNRIAPERLVHQCGSGVSAAANMLAMEIAGIHGTRLYPGSWSEWCADPARPIETSTAS